MLKAGRLGRHLFTNTAKRFNGTSTEKGSKLSSMLWGAGLVAAGAGAGWYWFGPREEAGEGSTAQRTKQLIDDLQKPVKEKFLPPKQDDPRHPRPYTLVIDLDGFLVSHHWDRELGRWRVAKRPGAEIFLFYAAQLYEVVLFSSMQQFEGENVVRKLDPYGCISYSLFRFATRHEKGRYLKDLSVLNRDPAKVLVIGHDTEGFRDAQENMLVVKPWNGDPSDRSLEKSIDFLEGLALSRASDVRPVVSKFKDDKKYFPDSFDDLQRSTYEKGRQETEERKARRESSWLFRMFAFASPKLSNTKPLPDYETKKEERMAVRQKEWEHVKGIMQKQLEAEAAKEKSFNEKHKVSWWDFFSSQQQAPKSA